MEGCINLLPDTETLSARLDARLSKVDDEDGVDASYAIVTSTAIAETRAALALVSLWALYWFS